jgi:tRNA threonylcarbamoyladenosine dehydratase
METPRRFAGVARLFGESALGRIRAAHVCVVGIGGVGSWAAEALARSGVGRLTLIDLDHVAESNLNRQVLALESTLGAAKVDAMRMRIADIAPACDVTGVDEFVTPENASAIVPPDAIVVDAIDQVRAKAALVALCRERGQPVIVCGAAGGRHDPLRLHRDDLARIRGDALLSSLRARLRREHGFTRDAGRDFGVPAIHSSEPPGGETVGSGASEAPGAALACSGYGSIVTVTAAMGLAAASWAIDRARANVRRESLRRSAPRVARPDPSD